MKKVVLGIGISVLLLIGCGNSDGKNTITLQGKTWITEGCNVMIEMDSNNTKHTVFYKFLYRFDSDNIIHIGSNIYTDATCQKIIKRNPIETQVSEESWVYYTMEKESIKNGYDIQGIHFELVDLIGAGGEAITIDDIKAGNIGNNPFFAEGYYAIKKDRVCFSENLYISDENNYTAQDISPNINGMDILYWKSERLIIAPTNLKTINYERCLTLY